MSYTCDYQDITPSMIEHAKNKGMWAGSSKPIYMPDLLGLTNSGVVTKISRSHTPVLIKIIDEIIVNASDHALGNIGSVKNINIVFDIKTGAVSVYNDGPGIGIILHKSESEKKKRDVYLPEVMFTVFPSSTNFKKSKSCVKGGTNGVGAKLMTLHSNYVQIETLDSDLKLLYKQVIENECDKISTPSITKSDEIAHTKISFIPNYEALGYFRSGKQLLNDDMLDIDNWIRLRSHQVSAYLKKVAVSYNNVICSSCNIRQLTDLLTNKSDQFVVLDISARSSLDEYSKHKWDIAIIVSTRAKNVILKNMSIVNGVISNRGYHMTYIKELITNSVKDKLNKLTKSKGNGRRTADTNITKLFCIVMSAPVPGAEWEGQRKNELHISKEVVDSFIIPKTFLDRVCELIVEKIMSSNKVNKQKTKIDIDKYIKAKYSGKPNQTCLLIAEGDSAVTFLRDGLTINKYKQNRRIVTPSLDWFGIFSVQGVIINAVKELESVQTSSGNIFYRQSLKLQNNKTLLALADIFGLKYTMTYEKETEIKSLKYGKLVLCVDQDFDGIGKIAPLILVWIFTFWPNLIMQGRICRFITPIIRAYGKDNNCIEFYSENDFNKWMTNDKIKQHTIKYYKGLSSHRTSEIKKMFDITAFNKSIYTYTLDDTAKALFNVYFGLDSKLRKDILISPVEYLTNDENLDYQQKMIIPVGRVQLDIDTKSYKLEAIRRQIPSPLDQLNPVRRKIIWGSILRLTSAKMEIKVFQLSGFIADKMFYHHGEASLNKSIIQMAQSFLGGRKIPYLIGQGGFGNRHGNKPGSPRYISVCINNIVNSIFPTEDRYLLPYVYEEGHMAEPQYTIPVIPVSVLESYKIVSEGWNHRSYARDLDSVINIVKSYINGDNLLITLVKMMKSRGVTKELISIIKSYDNIKPCITGYKGDIRLYRGNQISFGEYIYKKDKNKIVILDLPIGVQTNKYLKSIHSTLDKYPRNQYIKSIEDRSSTNSVKIIVQLFDNVISKIEEEFGDDIIDPIEDLLNLKQSLKPNLNYYDNSGILEFKDSYLAIIIYWIPFRQQLYIDRINRQIILSKLKILEHQEILKYIDLCKSNSDVKLCNMKDDEEAAIILSKNGFKSIDSSLIRNNKYVSNEELEKMISNNDGLKYDYILNLRERDLTEKAASMRIESTKKLEALISKNINLIKETPTPCGSLWLKEIDEVVSKL